jgi:FtsZ-binding cell division protein ZapB
MYKKMVDQDENISNNNNKVISTSIIISKLTSCHLPSQKFIDLLLIIISLSSTIVGISMWVLVDNITGFGYIGMGSFSLISLCILNKMRLRAAIAKSVNILKQENDELKENNEQLEKNNEELEANVDELQLLESMLRNDVESLKMTVGLVGKQSDDVFKDLKIILTNVKAENKKLEFLVKNQIILYLHNNNHEIDKFKDILLELYSDIDWVEIKDKLKSNNLLLQ